MSVALAVSCCPDMPTACGLSGGLPDGPALVSVPLGSLEARRRRPWYWVVVCLRGRAGGEDSISNTVLLSHFLSRSGGVLL
jgi:hypothetical protein